MITVTGKTFDNRELLMSYNGRWNNDEKRWEFDSLLPSQLTILRATIGLIINEIPEPVEIISTPRNRFNGSGRSIIYGDDPTYHNHFADQNPTVFFGFSSLGAFTDYIDRLPSEVSTDPRRPNGWHKGMADFYGCESMADALKLARNGWQEGAERAAGIIDRLALANPRVRRRKPSVAGGSVSVGRMLAGDPRHMIHRPRQPGKKMVTFFVEAGMDVHIKAETAIIRAALIGAIVDLMENVGYSCSIIVTDTSIYNLRPVYQLTVNIKEAGERLNLNDIIFALGHPAFSRRFSFVAQTSVIETRDSWGDLGSPSDAFDDDHRCAHNEFYVPVIRKNVIDDDPFSILSYVVPNNLPIEIKRD